MAKNAPFPTAPEDPDTSGMFTLPDEGSFKPANLPQSSNKPGRVLGLDYEKWAVSVINLDDKGDRVTAARFRMKSKGYQRLEGTPSVDGYARPEVWVKPRALYEQDVAARKARLEAKVDAGELPASAIEGGQVHRPTRKPGKSG